MAVRFQNLTKPICRICALSRPLPVFRYAAYTTAPSIAEAIAKKTEAQTARAERTLRRFWKQVNLEDQDGKVTVLLDKRALKTPSGKPLSLPPTHRHLASLIAHEWDYQEASIRPHALPLTSLTSRALDGLSDPGQREQVITSLMRFLHTDTICFHEEHPESLVRLQEKHWQPLLQWINEEYKLSPPIKAHSSLFDTKQPAETEQRLRTVVEGFGPFQLAAFERAVLTSKSFCIALALVEGHLSVDEAARCAHVEVQSQIDRWGEVEDTHDVDNEDVRTRLGSAAMLLA